MARRGSVKRRVPVGAAAIRRRGAGGARARGRPAATLAEWAAIKEMVLARAYWTCQACGSCTRLDVHHVTKRSRGGSDFDLDRLVALCRACHERTDASYAQGRLVVGPLGAGRFGFALVHGEKWATVALDRWESLWPPSGGEQHAPVVRVCPCGQNGGHY